MQAGWLLAVTRNTLDLFIHMQTDLQGLSLNIYLVEQICIFHLLGNDRAVQLILEITNCLDKNISNIF